VNTSFPKEKMKILLLENIHPIAVEKFKDAGYENVTLLTKALPEAELIEALKDARVVGVRSKTQLTETVLNAAEKLIAIGCFCIGTNQVNLPVAANNGIAVFNAPYSNTRSVAELVIANIVMLMRRIPEKSQAAHKGDWLKTADKSYELRGKTIGIIGYGHIGSQVSILAEAFGMKVIYYDVLPILPLGNAQNADSLDKLLELSDIVTLHVPEDVGTKNMVTKAFIDNMKDGAIFLNLSRGSVVEIDALAAAIKSSKIGGAAVDVFPIEPRAKGEKFESSLQGLDNVILTPHIGGSTQEAQFNIGIDLVHKISSYMDTGSSVGSHSIPALNLPQKQKTHRILHIHKNVPGVLSSINSVLGANNINIVAQYLKTNENVGYVVVDVAESASDVALEKMKEIENTIKARILY